MKMFKKAFVGFAFMLMAGLALAHGNHAEEAPINKAEATARGDYIINALVAEKKLDGSWQKKTLVEAASKVTPKGALWVVSYNNPNEKDKQKQTIYILLDDLGNYVGANHTGKY